MLKRESRGHRPGQVSTHSTRFVCASRFVDSVIKSKFLCSFLFGQMVEAEAKSEEKNDTAIVGLRGLRVGINRSNLGKADSIFGQLLSGKIINQSQQSLTYTWEGSPMVLQVEILDPAGAAGVSDGVVGIEYFPREENFEKESQNPPFEPLTGAKMIPVRWTPTSSSRM